MATKTDCRNAVINAYGCLERDELQDAASFCDDAANWLSSHTNGDEPFEPEPVTETPPSRWRGLVARLNKSLGRKDAAEKSGNPATERRRITVKKAIGLIMISAIVGVGSNMATRFGGPSDLSRGEFSLVSQCEKCEAIRTGGKVCPQCGASESSERIAAELIQSDYRTLFMESTVGWQFKDGSTKLLENGEYTVPELVVSKTMRM